MNEYENIVIGLEVHVQLKTETKLFCNCPNEFGAEPNENTCPVCLGLPGTLPVINEKAIEYAIQAASALNLEVASDSKFDRKNYYYPDLPKAYQISQYDMPLASSGELPVDWNGKHSNVEIDRLHLEEDAGKLIHASTGGESYVDYNRTGTPLIEIVTGPDITHPSEAVSYLNTLKKRMEYLGVSDCNMEEGSLRCDANLSIRNQDGSLGVKTEVKNMNSFSAVESALTFEANRQQRLLDRGETIDQGTRLWDEDKEETRAMRTKEEEHDYRYFPEPDLVPLAIEDSTVEELQAELPEMPDERQTRFENEFNLDEEQSQLLTETLAMADFFEETVRNTSHQETVVNLMIADLRRELNERDWSVSNVAITPSNFAKLADLLADDVISSNVAAELLEELVEENSDPDVLVEELGLKQISDEDELTSIINEVLEDNPDAVDDVRSGKDQAIGFLVGQVMQKSQGQANPERAKELLRESINS
ncbi:MAG: Asp-tRNA(Asn)/Glu-tRNA(Gln) amidotransferase subunit GatB [bacterium]